jgi:uncharacterized Zn finger protein (UPF0148 family)
LNDIQIEIHCPDCDTGMPVMISQIKNEETVTCPSCKRDIHMKPDPKPTPEEERQMQEAMMKLNQALREKKTDH